MTGIAFPNFPIPGEEFLREKRRAGRLSSTIIPEDVLPEGDPDGSETFYPSEILEKFKEVEAMIAKILPVFRILYNPEDPQQTQLDITSAEGDLKRWLKEWRRA